MESIFVKNAVFYAYHGATKAQINAGQRFIIDAEVVQEMEAASQKDDPANLFNCEDLYNVMKMITTKKRFNLMQVLALEIIREIKKQCPKAKKITVGACKASCVLYNDCKNKMGGGGVVQDRIGVTLMREF